MKRAHSTHGLVVRELFGVDETMNRVPVPYSLVYIIIFGCLGTFVKAVEGNKSHGTPHGLQCYNCLSYDTPACWDPDHPSYANVTIPNIDCHMPGMQFYCIIITAPSAHLMDTGADIGAVRVRTCVPAKKFPKREISYHMCDRLSDELVTSEVFSKIRVTKPKCTLCHKHKCTEPTCAATKRFFMQGPTNEHNEQTED